MRDFNYSKIAQMKWDSEILSYIAAIYKEAGKQELYLKQRPEELDKLVEIAKIQSTESSNAIEGIVTTSTRIRQLVEEKTTPKNRDEQEIAGYRDVLSLIHENFDVLPLTQNYILQLHKIMYSHMNNPIEDARQVICDNGDLLAKRDAMQKEIGILVEMAQNAVERNARVAQNQEEYQKQYDDIISRYDAMKIEYEQLCEKIENRQDRNEQLGRFIQELKGRKNLLTEFDHSLWCALVDKMIVKDKENVTVVFQDGTEIKA